MAGTAAASSISGGGGVGVGFLGRVTSLEREINFLKQKVEDDARWKHLLEKWILDNFAFDIRGTLLDKQKREVPSFAALNANIKNNSMYAQASSSSSVKRERKRQTLNQRREVGGGSAATSNANATHSRSNRQVKKRIVEDEDFEDHDMRNERMEYEGGGGSDFERSADEGGDDREDNEGVEVAIDPRDLIITPDLCPIRSGGRMQTKKEIYDDEGGAGSANEEQDVNDFDYCSTGADDRMEDASSYEEDEEEGNSSSSEEKPARKNPKMEWILHSSYPSLENMRSNFNIREWGLMTTSRTSNLTKVYYYCKMCRKKGPGRMLVRYKSEDSEVEILKNTLQHDHSKKTRLGEEMKGEIVNLYKAGLKGSTQILNALKISKPDLRLPSAKQVNYTLKKVKKFEKKELKAANKEKNKDAKKKVKKLVKNSKPVTTQNDRVAFESQSSQQSSGSGSGGPVGNVRSASDQLNPQITSITSTLSHGQHFPSSIYTQILPPGGIHPPIQSHLPTSTGYDPSTNNNPSHLLPPHLHQQQQFHSFQHHH